jgi:hypothetical protein
MYGLSGGFGGTGYQSPFNAFTHGLEATAGLALRFKEERERRDQMAYERSRQDRVLAMQQSEHDWVRRHQQDAEQRQNQTDALKALNEEAEHIHTVFGGIIDQYGHGDPNAIPPDLADRLRKQYSDISGKASKIRRGIISRGLGEPEQEPAPAPRIQGPSQPPLLETSSPTEAGGQVAQASPVAPQGEEQSAPLGSGDPNKLPKDVLDTMGQIVSDHNSRRMALRQAMYGPFLEQQQQKAAMTSRALQAREIDPADPANAQDIAHMLAVGTHRDPADYLKAGEEPSRVEQGIADFHKGMDGQDPQKISNAMGTLFGPQLTAGRVGMLNRVGGTVTDVAPHPTRPIVPSPNGQSFYPVLQVTAQHPNGVHSVEPYAPPTAAGYDDPEDPSLVNLTPQKAMDHIGQIGTLQVALNHPLAQRNIRQALQTPNEDMLDAAHAFTALGSWGAKKGGGTLHNVNGNVLFFPSDGSNPKLVWSSQEKPQGALAQGLAEIQKLGKLPVEEGGLTPAEAKEARDALLHINKPEKPEQAWRQEAEAAIGQPNPYAQPDADGKRPVFKSVGEVLVAKMRGAQPQLLTAGEVQQTVSDRVADAEQGFDGVGVYRSTGSPTGYSWAGGSKADRPVMGADMGRLNRAISQTRNQARQEALQARHGGGIAPPSPAAGAAVMQVPGSNQITTQPPPMSERVEGKTTITRPNGTFVWGRDPNGGKVGWIPNRAAGQ